MNFKYTFSFFISLTLFFCSGIEKAVHGQSNEETVDVQELYVRDLYSHADEESQKYYLYKAGKVEDKEGREVNGVVAYKSWDLEKWEGPYPVLARPENNWVVGPVWAPEVHH